MSETAYGDKLRWGQTLALGMLVSLWRILLPTNTDITIAVVALVALLDLALTAAVVFLNRKELKDAWARRFAGKDVVRTVVLFAICVSAHRIFSLIYQVPINGVPIIETLANTPPPADWVAMEFQRVFPLGIFISAVILAPIWEETVFRLAGKNLIKNPILFVVITTCMFAFIHTVNFSIVSSMNYLFFGLVFSVSYLVLKDIRILMITHFLWNLMVSIIISLS